MSVQEPIVIKSVKKRSKFKIASLIGIPLAALAVGYAYYPKSSNLFDGEVGGWEVSYYESPQRGNMIARKGSILVSYEDNESSEKIDFKSRDPKSLAAKLEFIAYTDEKGTQKFYRKDSDPSSFDFEARNQIFDAADRHYNAIRVKIVEDLQKRKLERLEEIKNNLK